MKLSNYTKKSILFILPLILLCVSLVLLATIGFNRSIDFKTYYQFDVHFGTTLNSDNVKAYKNEINRLANVNNVDVYSMSELNENIDFGIQVKVLSKKAISNATMETRVTAFENSIKDIDGINTDAYITVTNHVKVLPHSWGNYFWKGLLTVLVSMAVIFAYIWFRFELKLALSYAASVVMAECLTLSAITILRLPVGLNFVTPYVVTFFVLSALFAFTFVRVRANNTDNKSTNAQTISLALKESKLSNVYVVAAISCVILLSICAFANFAFSVEIQSLLGVASAIYTLAFVLIPMWSYIYNRDKDTRLAARQRKEADKLEQKDKDKLVV